MKRAMFLAIALLTLGPAAAQTESYPSRAIRLVVPFAAGGGNDILARVISQRLTERWGQPALVENKPGAGGNIGAEFVARSAPDGYTLLLATNTVTIAPWLSAKTPFDVKQDFAPVALLAATPFALVVAPEFPVNTVAELVAYARANPGRLSYASVGVGTPHHLGMELFKSLTGTDLLHVPYKGSVPALTDIAANRAQAMLVTINAAAPFIQGGRVRVLAVAERRRIAQMKDVPTVIEAGVADFEVSAWYALLAPAKTPEPVVRKLAAELTKLFAEPELRERLAPVGFEMSPGTPEQLRALIHADLEKWGRVVKAAGIKAE